MKTVIVVAAALCRADGKYLIAQRPAGKELAGHWEFPGGKLEAGENDLDGLLRELREELAIEAHAVSRLTPLTVCHHDYPRKRVELRVFRGALDPVAPIAREGQALRWVAVDELAASGLLPADVPVVAALLAL